MMPTMDGSDNLVVVEPAFENGVDDSAKVVVVPVGSGPAE
jgi:hypothetical protein